MIDRREALRRMAGGAAAAGFLAWDADELLNGLRAHGGGHASRPVPIRTRHRFQTLTAHQRATIVVLAEMIIPATDTPGAGDAAIDEFADIILSEWLPDDEKAHFLEGLAGVDAEAQRAFGTTFHDATPAQRTELMARWDAELTAARTARQAWRRDSPAPQPPDHRRLFFHQIRSLTVSGYYSSESGYKRERKAAIVPGIYTPCTPAAEA
jgi:hypothetical protein